MKYRLVEVTWDDAHTSEGWTQADEAQRKGATAAPCVTTGLLIVDNPRAVTIACTASYEDGVLSQVNGTMTIPRGMVRRVRRLK